MGKGKKSKAQAAEPVVDETVEETAPAKTSKGKGKQDKPAVDPMDRIAQRGHDKKNLQPNWTAFQQYVIDHGGPTIKPEHIGVVLTGYKHYQKSDHAVAARNEVSSAVAQTREQKEQARAERAKQAAARREEQQEAKAAKEKTASKASKTAASASKPAKKVAASSASKPAAAKKVAAKKAPAKKVATKKTAGKGAKAPY